MCHTCQVTSRDISRPVCLLGLGLIGGSLLRDLSALGHPAFGFNRSPSGTKAAQQEGFDVSSDLVATVQRAEQENALLMIATPMPAVASILAVIKEHAPSCGITDVVSVKAQVLDLVREAGLVERYVGGHPMAGTSESGWQASRKELFKGAAWVVTFDHAYDSPEGPGKEWIELWTDVVRMAKMVKAEVIPSRVDAHDSAVARISHLPHVLAETLAIVGDNGGALSLSLAASSFRDSTRVAATSPSLVRAMCETNSEALLVALDEALALLQDARAHLSEASPSMEELADNGYRSRIRYEARSGHSRQGADSVSPSPISGRPVLSINPGSPHWLRSLEQAENLGARIEVSVF
ncbi:prephenate dehydrogenase [Corynebacterium occultum]|uniref:Prephenate dehydrogenase n=1 Tax=Corynebacterium occultum TaxID=2675219 RepID=A0A6B8VT63_9CORY|nr:prephenate dehydrogenase [Corynebacterium occultum]